ncbi:hypothetical protein LCGC14_2796750, partial [marine sediment metagenome]
GYVIDYWGTKNEVEEDVKRWPTGTRIGLQISSLYCLWEKYLKLFKQRNPQLNLQWDLFVVVNILKVWKGNDMTTMQITVLLLAILVAVGSCIYARLRALIDDLDYKIERLENKGK